MLSGFHRVVVLAAASAGYTFSVNGGIINGNGLADLLAGYGPQYFAALWVLGEARSTRYAPAYHYGLYLWIGWPILVPHYLLKTRDARGVALAVGVYASLWAPSVAALIGWWFYEDLPDFR